ncbi:hypothetical protein IG631_19725 [Alternaria alternata]|nr:hypothetical protein IG631_19725 [Alternaria alternata]
MFVCPRATIKGRPPMRCLSLPVSWQRTRLKKNRSSPIIQAFKPSVRLPYELTRHCTTGHWALGSIAARASRMVQRLEERAPIGKHRSHDTVGGRYRLLTHISPFCFCMCNAIFTAGAVDQGRCTAIAAAFEISKS